MEVTEPKPFRKKRGYLMLGHKPLHRLIWEIARGQIPDKHDIHHKDGNKLNNHLDNLECIPHTQHLSLHAKEKRAELSQRMKANSDKIHSWLKTDKGKKFLSEKARKQWADRPFKTFTCQNCGKEFEGKHNRVIKFCSDSCVMKARRKSGVDNELRTCVICCRQYMIDKYQKTKTCSLICRNKLISILKLVSKK